MNCNKCGNELVEGSKFCNKCGNKIIKDEKNRNQENWTKNWKKILISSIVIFIITLVLKAILSNNEVIFKILNIPLYLALILFVISLVLGIYYMKVNQIKRPMWFDFLLFFILIFICLLIFGNISSNKRKNTAQKYANEYSSILYNRKIKIKGIKNYAM